jgi:drug/metabolite transporter (DMT)-like permease
MNPSKFNFYIIALIASVILFSLAPNLVKLMVTEGGRFGLMYPNAVSFCNVLFIGNLCAGLVTGIVFGFPKIFKELWQQPLKVKGYLLIASVLLAIYPSLIFIGLEYTSVINIVIITRFTGILYVIFSFIVYKSVVHKEEAIGYAIIALSVIALLIINNMGVNFSKGDILILIATFFGALTDIVSKKILPTCSGYAYTFCRNFFSAIIFLIIVLVFFKPGHLADAFHGELWVLMVAYAGVSIVLAQLLFLFALKKLESTTTCNVKLSDPIFTLVFAYLLLDEVPSTSQFIIIAIIFLCILIPKFILRRKGKVAMMETDSMDNALAGR